MQENVGEGLPDARRQQVGNRRRDETKPFEDPGVGGGAKKCGKRLQEEDAGANQNKELYARSDETPPIKVITPATERRLHFVSLRRGNVSVKERLKSRELKSPKSSRKWGFVPQPT